MSYDVFLVADAEKDILEIYNYMARNDSVLQADTLLQQLEQTCQTLSQTPHHGHIPPELERIGVLEYKDIHYKSYRIIYQLSKSSVHVHSILDGRRHLQELLQKRLLR